MSKVHNKVIALVYTHKGDNNYDHVATGEAKALLRKVNKALSDHYGHSVGTVFGDARGSRADGSPQRCYALCMEVPEHKVDWLLETFWGVNANGWREVIPGVGYRDSARGRAPMHAFDVSRGDEEVKDFLLNTYGIQWTAPPKTGAALKLAPARLMTASVDDNDPLAACTLEELQKLCAVAGIDYAEDDGVDFLRKLYSQYLDQ